jgi:hypothetical protein
MATAEEASTPAAEESAPLPQAETVALAAEAALPEASIVEGEYTAEMQPSSSSSRSSRETDPMCLLLTGAKVEGSTILEALPMEGIVPEAEVAAGAATGPAEIASRVAPRVAQEVRDDVLPESSLELVVRSPESKMRNRSVRCRCPRPPRLVVVDSSFWRMILLTRR